MKRHLLYFAWLICCCATLGSLYFSEIAHLEPCALCWIQRIALYPLTLVLGIAAYRGFYGIARYVLPQVGIGTLASAYQVLLQEIPGFEPISLCGIGPSCAEKTPIALGFVTLPLLSLLAFFLLNILLIFALRFKNQ